jgi:hypothetical protein
MSYERLEEATVQRVERERDDARVLAATLVYRLEEWRKRKGAPCPICGCESWQIAHHANDCPVWTVRRWFPAEKVGGEG